MKYLFLFLLIISFCTSASAQFEIELKPGRTDSAQLTYTTVGTNGALQTFREPFDTLPNVITYAVGIWRNGGPIGDYDLPDGEGDENTVRKILEMDTGMGLQRRALYDVLVDAGTDPARTDTLTAQSIIGVYTANGSDCFEGTNVEIKIESGVVELHDIEFIPVLYHVSVLTEDMFWIGNQGNSGNRVFIRDEDNPNLFRTPQSTFCTLIKQ